MNDSTTTRFSWLYDGLWGVLTNVFCVPRQAPELPSMQTESVATRKPSPGFLSYLQFKFWLVVAIVSIVAFLVGLVVVIESQSPLALIAALLLGALICIVALVGYLAICLRFDTTWYVFSDRSMRLRRGVWVIRESTITFENIQNVKVTQGPLQRIFGIANVVVETAGGGGGSGEPGAGISMHAGLIEGVAEAPQIRDSIMSHVKSNTTAGLGDDHSFSPDSTIAWSSDHLTVLREIRDLADQAAAAR